MERDKKVNIIDKKKGLVNRMKTLDKYLEEQLQNKEFKEEWENMQLQMDKEFLSDTEIIEVTKIKENSKQWYYIFQLPEIQST